MQPNTPGVPQHNSSDADEFVPDGGAGGPGEPGVFQGYAPDVVEQDVFLGELPIITDRGTFIINGAERVVVSQLHRSPGVFFDETIHPNGKHLYSARIIPFRGSWVEFEFDVNDIMFVHIDSRRKIPVTLLLRALGYSTDEEILRLFYPIKSVEKLGRPQPRVANSLSQRRPKPVGVNPNLGPVVHRQGCERALHCELQADISCRAIDDASTIMNGERAKSVLLRQAGQY